MKIKNVVYKQYSYKEIQELKDTPLFDLAEQYISIANSNNYQMSFSEALFLAKRERAHKTYIDQNWEAIKKALSHKR